MERLAKAGSPAGEVMDLKMPAIRVLGPVDMAAYHAHLLRLDRMSRWARFAAAVDDRAIDAHCLRLIATGAIVIGIFADNCLRGGAEIIPHAHGRRADAAFSIDEAWRGRGCGRMLVANAIAEAKARGLDELIFDVLEGNEPMLRLIANHGGLPIDAGRMLSFRLLLHADGAGPGISDDADALLKGYV